MCSQASKFKRFKGWATSFVRSLQHFLRSNITYVLSFFISWTNIINMLSDNGCMVYKLSIFDLVFMHLWIYDFYVPLNML